MEPLDILTASRTIFGSVILPRASILVLKIVVFFIPLPACCIAFPAVSIKSIMAKIIPDAQLSDEDYNFAGLRSPASNYLLVTLA
jgi:hypothetical protein